MTYANDLIEILQQGYKSVPDEFGGTIQVYLTETEIQNLANEIGNLRVFLKTEYNVHI